MRARSSRRVAQASSEGPALQLSWLGRALAVGAAICLSLAWLPPASGAWVLLAVLVGLLLVGRLDLAWATAPKAPQWLLPEQVRAGEAAVVGLLLPARTRPVLVQTTGYYGWRYLALLQAGYGPGQRLLWREHFAERGEHSLPPVWAQWHDGLGLWQRRAPWAPAGTVLVLPRGGHLRDGLAARLDALFERGHTLAQHGDDEPQRLRPFQAGDAPRHVHWPSSARAGELLVMSRAQVGNQSLTVWIDAIGSRAEVEQLVQLAAALVDHAARRRYHLRLLGSPGFVPPPPGASLLHGLEALARLSGRAQGPEPELPNDPALVVLSQRLSAHAAPLVLRAADLSRWVRQPHEALP